MHLLDTDERVKIKYAEYVRLHRLVTGLSARTVWEVLVAGGDLDALTEPLPDEFHAWVRGVATELVADVDARAAEVEEEFAAIVADLPDGLGPARIRGSAVAAPAPGRAVPAPRRQGLPSRACGSWCGRPGDVTPAGVKVTEE